MKGRRIVLDHLEGREAAALMVDGQLDDILIDEGDAPRPGAIYRAICDRPLKGQGGMMVRLPGGSGFLRHGKGLRPGQAILVQVTGVAEDGKAVPLTDRVLFKSRYAIVTPQAPGLNISRQIAEEEERARLRILAEEGMEGAGGDLGLILRSACAGAEEDEIVEDIAAMRDLAEAVIGDAEGREPEALTEGDGPHVLAWREWRAGDVVTEPGGFEREGVLDGLEALRSPRIATGDGTIFVEPTRALVAVDVNTGGDTTPAAALKANLAAARILPRALRLRGLGGQVVVDFAPMSKAHRKQLEQSLKAAFRADPVETSLVGWTTMGLFELQRKRERPELMHLLGRL
ncbi:ribonuclease E/G [Limimaricola pyoseonensis]|uniref:Ribonuclease, Rne/Rng family n=1 Tax=Limimaricola pyoseonensis TaxID=521013 RepID=A0A1G7IGE1_9RHOB|nr:ribonuclease E/G [Limimaricola pyoseonensis]SDF11594.1 ribonuclease, Rne/Rng family [Limimaricola pyoseonensis]